MIWIIRRGMAVTDWQHLARDLGRDYTFIVFDSGDASLAALADGQLDLAIGDITITLERIREFDVTEPIAPENLTLLLPSTPPSLWDRLRPFLGWAFLSSVGGIYLCLLIVGNLLWLAEHQRSQHFPRQYNKGLPQGIWYALVTLTSVGYGDVVPVTTTADLRGKRIATIGSDSASTQWARFY